jgi:hypothetical protein
MKSIFEKWKNTPNKVKASIIAIGISIVLLVVLGASSGSVGQNKKQMSPSQMAKQLKLGGRLVTLTAVVRGFAWGKVDWSPKWDQYFYGISRTAYVDYAIDVSELSSENFKLSSNEDGINRLTINLPPPALCNDTLVPPTEDKPIEFIHGKVFFNESKDKIRNISIERASQAISDTVKDADKELATQAKAFAEEELEAIYGKMGFDVEVIWKK